MTLVSRTTRSNAPPYSHIHRCSISPPQEAHSRCWRRRSSSIVPRPFRMLHMNLRKPRMLGRIQTVLFPCNSQGDSSTRIPQRLIGLRLARLRLPARRLLRGSLLESLENEVLGMCDSEVIVSRPNRKITGKACCPLNGIRVSPFA